MKPVTAVRLPACSVKANIDRFLGVIGIILAVLLILVRMVARGYSDNAAQTDFAPVSSQPQPDDAGQTVLICLLSVVGIYLLAKILRVINLNAVTIVDRDDVSAELCFKREAYAREFCALNNLTCHDRSFAQRKKARDG